MVEKLTINYLATALVDSPAVSMPTAHSLKTFDICCIVVCDKTADFRVAFYCPSTRCTCVMIMLFNQILDMPHMSGGWIILAKEKGSLTWMETNLLIKILEKEAFCSFCMTCYVIQFV
jgi:hypothetical protein